MNSCRCTEIIRAKNELTRITNGLTYISNVLSATNRERDLLTTVADAVHSGAYSTNRDSNADAIERIVIPVNVSVSNIYNDFINAQTIITNRLNNMQIEDNAFHKLQVINNMQRNT